MALRVDSAVRCEFDFSYVLTFAFWGLELLLKFGLGPDCNAPGCSWLSAGPLLGVAW